MSDVTSEGELLVGRYRIVGRLGRGGMAEVWEAHDDVLGRPVAVKVFDAADDDAADRRVVAEMHTLAGLSHGNLVTVYDAGTDGDRMFLVMELVAGPTLADRIVAPGVVDPVEAALIGAEVAAGLAYIHRRGIVHRDVKPANVLLPSRDHADAPVAKLADFGIAQHAGQERLTRTGMTIGTVRYLAPEQLTGGPVGAAADVYALGLVLLELRNRAPAWSGTSIEIAMARLTTAPVVPSELGPVWAPLLTAMTATDPAVRPTASEVREVLAGRSSPRPVHAAATQETPPPTALMPIVAAPERRIRRRTPLIGWATGVVGVAAVIVGAIVLTGHDPAQVAPTGAVTTAAVGPAGSTTANRTSTAASATAASAATPSATTVVQTSAVAPTPTPAGPNSPPAATGSPSAAPSAPAVPGGPPHTPPGQTKSKGKGSSG